MFLLLSAATLALSACGPAANDWQEPARENWPLMGGDWGNTRYSTLTQITTQNVKELGGAWVKDFGAESSRSTPVVWDGLMFMHAGPTVYALDPATGETKWSYKPPVPPGGLMKSLAVGEGLLFIGLSDSNVVAVEQKTGKFVWQQLMGDEKPANIERMGNQWIGGSPTYASGLVIAGVAGGRAPSERNDGRVAAVNAKTGEKLWTFHVVPAPGEPGHETWSQDNDVWKKGGGPVWVTPAVDPELGLVYFGTGNAIPELGGQMREGDNLYTAALVALDLKTGKLKWHYQLTRHDIWEHDLGTPPILYDAAVEGKRRKAVGIMRTDGYLFLLDRATGQPVSPIEERAVPQSAALKTVPTQPFPVGDQIGPNCVEKDMLPPGFELGCYFDVIDTTRPNLVTPLMTTRSSPMAYSPQTDMFYAAGVVYPRWLRLWEDPFVFSAVHNIPGTKSYGIIAAIDAKTNRIAWQKRSPYRIENGSGMTATAGGLMFHGEPDGQMQAYDAKTGEILWQFQTGGDNAGAISVYEAKGEQYVAAMATNALWAFKLRGTVPPRTAGKVPPTETTFSGRVIATDTINMSEEFEDTRSMDVVRRYVDEYAFAPQRARAEVGAKVTWTNTGKKPHTATAVDGAWTTGEVQPGKSATVTFDKPGTYVYTCKEHPWSYGQIIIE